MPPCSHTCSQIWLKVSWPCCPPSHQWASLTFECSYNTNWIVSPDNVQVTRKCYNNLAVYLKSVLTKDFRLLGLLPATILHETTPMSGFKASSSSAPLFLLSRLISLLLISPSSRWEEILGCPPRTEGDLRLTFERQKFLVLTNHKPLCHALDRLSALARKLWSLTLSHVLLSCLAWRQWIIHHSLTPPKLYNRCCGSSAICYVLFHDDSFTRGQSNMQRFIYKRSATNIRDWSLAYSFTCKQHGF